MTNKTQESITIDLNNRDYAFLDTSSNLQVNAFKKVDHIVNEILAHNDEKGSTNVFKDFKYQSKNNVIYIQGSRGAGKTTFLKYILQHYHNNDHKVKPIAFIDPTTISTQQHILTEIVSKLNNICFPVEGNAYPKNDFFEEWNKQLSEISKGMELLSSKNTTSNPHDSAWFLGKALNNSTSGQQLEYKLHKLIDIAIKHLGAKSLLIAIDDIDTQTEKAYELLETIRCYLTHPKLIVLISGDLELYSHIVSEHKYNEIMINYNKDKFSEKDDVRGLVNQLEQQYLIKVLPLTQRVCLDKLIEISNSRTIEIKNSNDTEEIKEFLSQKLSSELGVSKTYISKYRDFILSQPIRSVVQLLSFLTKENNDETLENQLRNLFIRDFTENKINLDLLEVDGITPSKLGYETVKLLDAHNDLETGFYCRPDSENEGYNASKLFLSTLASDYISRNQNTAIGNALNIMLTIGATSSIYLNFVKDNLEQDKTIEDYLNYIELGRGDRIVSLVEHFSPICLSQKNNNQKMLSAGVFRTPRKKADVDNQCLSNREKLGDKIENTESLFDYMAGVSILLSSSSNITNKGETRDYVSIYTFMAAIADLLSLFNEVDNDVLLKLTNKELNEKIYNELINKLKVKLSNLLSIRTYSSPSFIQSIDKGDDDFDDKKEDETEYKNEGGNYDKACHLLMDWILSIPRKNNNKTSLIMLGKIWTRIFYSINNISNNIKSDSYLGETFSKFIWGLCNSVLIEEVRYNNNSINNKNFNEDLVNGLIMAKNVSTSITSFKVNLGIILNIFKKSKEVSFKQMLPITYSILSCPLLYPFLLKEKVFYNSLNDIISESYSDIVKFAIDSHNEKSYEEELNIIKLIFNSYSNKLDETDKINELNKLVISELPMVGFSPQFPKKEK